jgi:hypothetical protein
MTMSDWLFRRHNWIVVVYLLLILSMAAALWK